MHHMNCKHGREDKMANKVLDSKEGGQKGFLEQGTLSLA